jgi:hypothetical protein
MTDHISPTWFAQKARRTEDGKASVLDLIRFSIAGRGERVVWQRLKEQNPELEGLVDCVTFRDAVGRQGANTTPVVDLEGWLQILALLPGAAGKKYRKASAELVVRAWRGDADLGLQIMLRDADKVAVARAKKRLRVAEFNKRVTAESMSNGERPDRVHDARYRGFYQMHTGKVRNEMGLTKIECPLDFMDEGELAEHELIQHRSVKAHQNKGGSLQGHVHRIARDQRRSYMEQVGAPPLPPRATESSYMDVKIARAISASHDSGQLGLFAS